MDLKRGAVIAGDFIVEAILARDANAVVFAAKQQSGNRLVTVKLFFGGDSGQRFLATFARASQIKSDFVPKLLDLGTLPDGNSYLVREYIEGEDLRSVVSRGALTTMEAVQFVLQACDAVASTHVVGVIHGGLKTSSLILTRLSSGAPVIKVLNCGLARVAKADPQAVNPYRAPEQLEGRKVDGRCDIWALGVILYELLSREPPFAGSTAKSLSKRVLNDAARALRSVRRDVPEALEAVVHRCLEKAPEARFSTIADLATALGPFGSVHSVALPVRIARMKLPASMIPSSPAPSSARSENESSRVSAAPASEPRASSSLRLDPFQMMAGGEEEAAVRKMTSEGRIERLDADAAALAVREKRVAAEVMLLARDAKANPRQAPVEDTGMRVLDAGMSVPPPPAAPEATTKEGKAWWLFRHPVALVLTAALAAGLLVGVIVRVMANRPHAERQKPREIIVEDRPTSAPVKRSVP